MWGREVGVAGMRAVSLAPEVVAIAAVEGPKLRAAARHVVSVAAGEAVIAAATDQAVGRDAGAAADNIGAKPAA